MIIKNKYIIGTHIMFYEIDMAKEHIQSILNAIQTIDENSRDNVCVDLFFNISEYFENLYNHHFDQKDLSKLDKIQKINNLICKHEEIIANKLLDYINSVKKIRLIGKKTIKKRNRMPTISFTVKGMTSKLPR